MTNNITLCRAEPSGALAGSRQRTAGRHGSSASRQERPPGAAAICGAAPPVPRAASDPGAERSVTPGLSTTAAEAHIHRGAPGTHAGLWYNDDDVTTITDIRNKTVNMAASQPCHESNVPCNSNTMQYKAM